MSDPQPLTPAQEAVRDKIIAYGISKYFTEQQIDIALRTAFKESAFGRDIDNDSSTAYGLYQYTIDTWLDNHIDLDWTSMDDQIEAFYLDLADYTGRWMEARAAGEIPMDLSLGEYVYVLHHDGRNTTNENIVDSAVREIYRAIADYYIPGETSDLEGISGDADSSEVVGSWEDDLAFWAMLGDVPIYDLRLGGPYGGSGHVGDSEFIPPDGGPPIIIPGDAQANYFFLLF